MNLDKVRTKLFVKPVRTSNGLNENIYYEVVNVFKTKLCVSGIALVILVDEDFQVLDSGFFEIAKENKK